MKSKNLLITGAATRVGRAIALHFAERGWEYRAPLSSIIIKS